MLRWEVDAELAALLRRYYRGEAGLWPDIVSMVHDALVARGVPVEPRHLRFRRTDTGYEVIVESAEGYAEY